MRAGISARADDRRISISNRTGRQLRVGHGRRGIGDRDERQESQQSNNAEEHIARISSDLHITAIMTLELTDDEARSLAILLRGTITDDPYPLSPRLAPLKAILAKLHPPQPPSGSVPPLQARDAPSTAGRRRRRG
jgi:hypothetical protein